MHFKNITLFLWLIVLYAPLLRGMQGNKPLYTNGIVSFSIEDKPSLDATLLGNKLDFVMQEDKRLGNEGTEELCNQVYRCLVGREKPENILMFRPVTTYEVCHEIVCQGNVQGSIINNLTLKGLIEINEPHFRRCNSIFIEKFFFVENLSKKGIVNPAQNIKVYPAGISFKPNRFYGRN
jgi:hypothetical protein